MIPPPLPVADRVFCAFESNESIGANFVSENLTLQQAQQMAVSLGKFAVDFVKRPCGLAQRNLAISARHHCDLHGFPMNPKISRISWRVVRNSPLFSTNLANGCNGFTRSEWGLYFFVQTFSNAKMSKTNCSLRLSVFQYKLGRSSAERTSQ